VAKSVLLTGFVTGAFLVGTTQAAFTDGDDNGTNQFQAGYWVPQHMSLVGTASCAASTTDVVTVTAPIPVGNTLIVRMTTRDGDVTNPTAADSRGNTYQRDAYVDANKIDYAIFSAAVTTALSPGDTITVTHAGDTRGTFVRVDEFAGIRATNRVYATNTDKGNAKSVSVSVQVPDRYGLVIAGVGIKDSPVVVTPTGWTILNNESSSCDRNHTSLAGYQITSATGTVTFDPSWAQKKHYSTAIVVYRGA
jgi:hypothetical protein